jgi:hypothetical protein
MGVLSANESTAIKWIFEKYDEKGWTGLKWLRVGSNDGIL